jgi:hypothetical protein
VIERRDAGGRDADQHPVLCRLRLGQYDLPQPAKAEKVSASIARIGILL